MRAAAVGAAAGLVAVFAVGGAAAQAPDRDRTATVVTLREALERAAQFNPEYRQALNRMELEEPQRREALGAFLPDLRLSFGTGQSFTQQRTAVDFFGNPIDNEATRTVGTSTSSQGASLGLDLLRGGERFHAYDQARAQARVNRLGAERDLNRVLAEVHRQFLIAQRQRARLAVEEELLAARESDYDVQLRMFELASVGRSDLLASELDLEGQRVAVTEYRGQVEKAMLALRRAIGDPSLELVRVEQELPEPFDPAGLDLEALVATAVRQSPFVGAAEAERTASQAALSTAKAARWPTLSLSSSVSRSAFGPDRSAFFDLDPGDFRGSFSFSVSIPVFTRFQTSQRIASASVNLRNAGEQVRQAELEREEQVRARFVDLGTAWANVRQREVALGVANERLRIVQEEYRLATKNIEDLRAAVRDQATAQRDAVDQRFEFASALLNLHEAAGIVAREAGLETTREED